jgi:hypothetical protein
MLNDNRPEIIPDFRIVRFDETEYWNGAGFIHRAGGKIWGIYYFDANRRVFCCEMTPSYELWRHESSVESYPVAAAWERKADAAPDGSERSRYCSERADREREDLDDVIREADAQDDGVSYFHCHTINVDKCDPIYKLTAEEWSEILADHDGDTEKAYMALVENVRENLCGNSYWSPSWNVTATPENTATTAI